MDDRRVRDHRHEVAVLHSIVGVFVRADRAHEELVAHVERLVERVRARVDRVDRGYAVGVSDHRDQDVGLDVCHVVVLRRPVPPVLVRAGEATRAYHTEVKGRRVVERRQRRRQFRILLLQVVVEEVVVVRVIRQLCDVVAVGGTGIRVVIRQRRIVPHGVADVQLVAVRQIVGVGVELVDRKREVVRRVAEFLQVELLRHVLQEGGERHGVSARLGSGRLCRLPVRVRLPVRGSGCGCGSGCSRFRRGRIVAVEVVDRRVHHDNVGHVTVSVSVHHVLTVRRCSHVELAVDLEHGVNGVALLLVTILEAGVDRIAASHLAGIVRCDHHLQRIQLVRHHVVHTGHISVREERIGTMVYFIAVRDSVAVSVGLERICAVVVLVGVR